MKNSHIRAHYVYIVKEDFPLQGPLSTTMKLNVQSISNFFIHSFLIHPALLYQRCLKTLHFLFHFQTVLLLPVLFITSSSSSPCSCSCFSFFIYSVHALTCSCFLIAKHSLRRREPYHEIQ